MFTSKYLLFLLLRPLHFFSKINIDSHTKDQSRNCRELLMSEKFTTKF